MDIIKLYEQTDNISYINNRFGKEQWVRVSGHCEMGGADAAFWCGLVRIEHIDSIFRDHSWDINYSSCYPGFIQSGDECTYYRNSKFDENFEPLIIGRSFYGIKDDYVEISEEFRLLNNLYYDKNDGKYYCIIENGVTEEVVRTEGTDNVFINLKYLKRFASAKQMAVLLFFDIRVNIPEKDCNTTLSDFSYEEKAEDLFYAVFGGQNELNRGRYSVLMGKKVIFPMSVEKCGYWPYDKEREYLDFIIGLDDNGEEITYTSDPNLLSNYFGANQGAPHYLTPVFFKREVLDKYYKQPKLYQITSGRLECCGLWGIEIHNYYKNYVSVFLGDLGRDLPEQEQAYWKSFNVLCDEKFSKTAFQRDFLCMPVSPEIIDLKFKNDYATLNSNWEAKYGWKFFKELTDNDVYNFENMRIPSANSQEEFDGLVLSLVKIIIDSINEEKLTLQNETDDEGKSLRGISRLERWFCEQNINGYELYIRFLRDIQSLRSTGTGHRKGKNYEIVCKKFDMDNRSLIDVFESILQNADGFVLFLQDIVDEQSVS